MAVPGKGSLGVQDGCFEVGGIGVGWALGEQDGVGHNVDDSSRADAVGLELAMAARLC